jgi:hypothetical protein
MIVFLKDRVDAPPSFMKSGCDVTFEKPFCDIGIFNSKDPPGDRQVMGRGLGAGHGQVMDFQNG